MYIVKVHSIHWDKTQILQKFPSDKLNGTKNALFFLSRKYYGKFLTSKCCLMTSFFQNLIPKLLLLISAIFVNIFGGLFALLNKEAFISAVFSFLFAQLQFFSSQIRVKVFSIAIICNQLVHIHHLKYSFPCECNTCSFLFLWKHCVAITCWMITLHALQISFDVLI